MKIEFFFGSPFIYLLSSLLSIFQGDLLRPRDPADGSPRLHGLHGGDYRDAAQRKHRRGANGAGWEEERQQEKRVVQVLNFVEICQTVEILVFINILCCPEETA